MTLLERLMNAFKPRSHDNDMSHYIPSIDYANQPILNSVWRSDLEKRLTDWKGDTGRVPDSYVATTQGSLLFALKTVPTEGLGGTSIPYGQGGTYPVAGFAGRPSLIDATSSASEFVEVNL